LLCGLLALAADALAQDTGRVGLPDSWKSEEFKRIWGLEAINAHHAYARGLSGRGISIGHYDNGTALQHPEFAGRGHVALKLAQQGCEATGARAVLWGSGRCFASTGDSLQELIELDITDDGAPEIRDEYENHGTHTAGPIAAVRDGKGMHGVAFESRLVIARFHPAASLSKWNPETEAMDPIADSSGLRGPPEIDAFFRQLREHGAEVANLELWVPAPEPPHPAGGRAAIEQQYRMMQAEMDALADSAKRYSVLNVVTLGNDEGNVANAFSGIPAFRPDAQPYWLSVANLKRDQAGALVIDKSSSLCAYTRMWCISAPGTDTYSASVSGGSGGRLVGDAASGAPSYWERGEGKPQMTYDVQSGTSNAAPHVAGAVGLLRERFPYLAVTQLRDVLLTTARDLGAPGPDEVYGWGLLDLRKAIDGPGQLLVDTEVQMTRRAGGTKVWQGNAWDDWRNDIGGTGALIKSGPGILRLSGRNRFGGLRVREGVLELTGDNAFAAQVQGGALQVDGVLASAALPVLPAGRLQGSGRIVGDVHMAGTLAPGNSIGTLAVQGNYVQAPGSTYQAEVDAHGHSDLIEVTGKAQLQGGRVVVAQAPGQYWLGQSFDLLHAGEGVEGRFASVEQGGLPPFLAFGLAYSARTAGLQVTRGELLGAYARTPNQRAAAWAADRLAIDQGLPRALTQLWPAQAMSALESLHGASHASVSTLLVEDSERLREAALERARAGRGAFAADAPAEPAQGAWAAWLASSTKLPGDGNASTASIQGDGVLLGYDQRFGSGLRLGVLAGASRNDGTFGKDRSRIRGTQLGVYAGQNWGWVQPRREPCLVEKRHSHGSHDSLRRLFRPHPRRLRRAHAAAGGGGQLSFRVGRQRLDALRRVGPGPGRSRCIPGTGQHGSVEWRA